MKLLLMLAIFGMLEAVSWGKILHVNIRQDDRKLVQLSEGFGYRKGILKWTLRMNRSGQDLNWDRLGIFVHDDTDMMEELMVEVEEYSNETSTLCLLDNDQVTHGWEDTIIRFSDSALKASLDKEAAFEHTYLISKGTVALYFANCLSKPLSFVMDIEEYNLDAAGHKNYLSAGDMELETVYWVMFSFFTAALVGWCWFVWKNRTHSHKIHLLMASLCLAKVLTLMSQALMYHEIARTGTASGWNIVYYIFTFFRGTLLFTVIALIGMGWSYMKPFLGDRDKRILMVVVPLQVLSNIAIVILDEASPAARYWFTWRDIFHLVDIICCCAILFPIVWSIKNLREAAHTDGKAARNLEKLTLFRQFYIVVVVYIYFTRIVVFLLRSTLPYEYTWISDAADELVTLAFYVWTGVSFSPTESNPYLKLRTLDEELEASEIELEQTRLL